MLVVLIHRINIANPTVPSYQNGVKARITGVKIKIGYPDVNLLIEILHVIQPGLAGFVMGLGQPISGRFKVSSKRSLIKLFEPKGIFVLFFIYSLQ